jgi:hypothetical protein
MAWHSLLPASTADVLSLSIRNQHTVHHKKMSCCDVANAPLLLPAQHALMSSTSIMAVDSLLPPPAMALEGMMTTDMEVETLLHDLAAVELTYQ